MSSRTGEQCHSCLLATLRHFEIPLVIPACFQSESRARCTHPQNPGPGLAAGTSAHRFVFDGDFSRERIPESYPIGVNSPEVKEGSLATGGVPEDFDITGHLTAESKPPKRLVSALKVEEDLHRAGRE